MSYGSKYATTPLSGSDPRRIHPVQKIADYFPQIVSNGDGRHGGEPVIDD